jgi:hypothetical protein
MEQNMKNTTLSVAISLALLGGNALTPVQGATLSPLASAVATDSLEFISNYSIKQGPPKGDKQAGKQDKPEKPADKPNKPEKPAGKPDKPEKPADKPDKPEKPADKPDKPEKPADKPDKPEKPADKPDKPEKPADKPDKPEKPADKPDKPEKPADKPDKPEKPANKPDKPEKPAEKPDKPEKPAGKPDKPGKKPPKPKKDELKKFGSDDVANLPEESIEEFEADDFEALPEDAVKGFKAKHLKKVGKKAAKGFKAHHIKQLPPDAFEGATGDFLGGLEPLAIQAVDGEQLEAIPNDVAENLPEEDAAKVLANLDPEILEGEDLENATTEKAKKIKKFLPPGWVIGKGNALKRPVGASIVLRPLPLPPQSTAGVKLAQWADLNAGFGLGGNLDENGSALDGLNGALEGTDITLEQDPESGILTAEIPDGGELAFVPDGDGIVQGDPEAESGVTFNEETGQFVVVIEGGAQIPVNPAPKDPDELVDALPEGATVEIGENAETQIVIGDEETGDQQAIGCVFDPVVQPAPEGLEPGIHTLEGPGGEPVTIIVYDDGTSQEIHPAVPNPDEFKEAVAEVEGVENVEIKADGSVVVTLEGGGDLDGDGEPDNIEVDLTPDFDIDVGESDENVDDDTDVDDTDTDGTDTDDTDENEDDGGEIGINDDGTVTFTDEDGDSQTLSIGDVRVVGDTDDDDADDVDVDDDADDDDADDDDADDDDADDDDADDDDADDDDADDDDADDDDVDDDDADDDDVDDDDADDDNNV